MTRSVSFRHTLLIGASLGSLVLATVSHAQSNGPLFGSRGGSSPVDAATRAAQGAAAQAADTSSATRRAIQSFQRAAAARTAMDAAQRAARAAAQAARSGVPDGLAAGGLQVASGAANDATLWQGANAPTQTTGSDGRTAVTVEQTKQQAILNWDSFNIGTRTDLKFSQGGSDWAVLNRVTDTATDPTKILGTITAPGTVLVMNRNGVIFGGASQVNVRNLVAGAVSIGDTQFLKSGIYSTQQYGTYAASFTDALGTIKVEAGAQITTAAPATVTDGGGYVLLLGATVENAGSIRTPKGQTLLAAGDDFLVRKGLGTDQNQYATTRGNEVRALTDEGSDSGGVANSGAILAALGDITLTGRSIAQDGVLFATTGVNQRGTIHLLASASDTKSAVTIGAHALTMIAPDLDSTDTALDSQRDALVKASDTANLNRAAAAGAQFDNLATLADRLDQSRVEIVSGGDVTLAGGSQTSAQGGQVAVQANAGRITVADGALIDVSGVQGVALDMASNVIKVNVQGNELRDASVNRDTDALKNVDVWLDIRDLVYVPAGTGGYAGDRWYTRGGLLEVGGYLGTRGHGIGEWAAVGGTITLAAKDVVASQGATFDLSGGSLDYKSGYITSTRVMDSDGRIYDIAQAPAGFKMAGYGDVFTRSHDRWGTQYTQGFADTLFGSRDYSRRENGYTVGRDAGTLILSSPTVLFDADIVAGVLGGAYQTGKRADGTTDGYKTSQTTVAQAGTLALRDSIFAFGAVVAQPVASSITISKGAPPSDRTGTAWFDSDRLSAMGLGGLTLWSSKGVAITDALTLAVGGRVDIQAPWIDVAAPVTARGGSVTLGNFVGVTPLLDDAGAAAIAMHSGAMVDTRGLWTNYLLDGTADPARLAYVDGGVVTLRLTGGGSSVATEAGAVTLATGSKIDASAGGAVLADGTIRGGDGGDITLATYDWRDTAHGASSGVATLTLDGSLASYGFGEGGALTLTNGTGIVIGNAAVNLSSGQLPAGVAAPFSLKLTQDYRVLAGESLPTVIMRTFAQGTSVAGEALPIFYARSFIGGQTRADWVDIPVAATYTNADFRTVAVLKGGTIPAGARAISLDRTLPATTVVRMPAGVLDPYYTTVRDTNGLAVSFAAGSVLPYDVVAKAGSILTGGIVLPRNASIVAPLKLDPRLFASGFSNYTLNGELGVSVGAGTTLDVVMPVYQFTAGAKTAASGSEIDKAAEIVLLPRTIENPVTGVMTRRGGASLALTSGDSVTIGKGAEVTVDPGQSIRATAKNSIMVDGSLTAHGGTIALLPDLVTDNLPKSGRVLWIGGAATLDVSGEAASAVDARGRRYGLVQAGGSLLVGLDSATPVEEVDVDSGIISMSLLKPIAAPVVIRTGAQLLADGASTVVDTDAGAVTLGGAGGLIRLGSTVGIAIDGTLSAHAGGAQAAGGTLNVVLEGFTVPDSSGGLRVDSDGASLTITQVRGASGLPADLTSDRIGDTTIQGARVDATDIAAGGFGTLDLYARNSFIFDGNVSLHMTEALALHRGVITPGATASSASIVDLYAPYALLDGAAAIKGAGASFVNTPSRDIGSLILSADLIDIRNQVTFGNKQFFNGTLVGDLPGFDTVTLSSSGDVRFTGRHVYRGDSFDPTLSTSFIDVAASIASGASAFTITASQLYPVGGNAGITLGDVNMFSAVPDEVAQRRTLTINGLGDHPVVPMSAFGSLTLFAPVIHQNGVLRAPLGSITLGGAIQYTEWDPATYQNFVRYTPNVVTFGAGSITSVSAKGLVMPYGGTIDGVSWSYDGQPLFFGDPVVRRGGITINASSTVAEAGSLLDLSGGGTLTGAGFISGRGGSVDVLRAGLLDANPANGGGTGAAVYALVPGYAGAYAPRATGGDAGDPAIGRQITLDRAVGDLPAGTYTLMPSSYALLPGAYRIELGAGAPVAAEAQKLANGSWLATGTLSIVHTAVRDALPTRVTITPGNTLRGYAQYNETSYSGFAIANAAAFNAPRPQLERDASSLTLALGVGANGVDFRGEADFNAADGGRAGNLFVTGVGSGIEIRAAGTDATTGYASITDAQLAPFDAGTLTIGGSFGLLYPRNDYAVGPKEFGPQVVFDPSVDATLVRSGVTLGAGQVYLLGEESVTVEGGATIDTRNGATNVLDSTLGYVFSVANDGQNGHASGALLAASNGRIDMLGATPGSNPSRISVGDGASLLTRGSLVLSSSGAQTIGDVALEARYLSLAGTVMHIGSAADIVAAGASGGVALTQAVLDRLLKAGTAVERLTLTASQSIDLYGDAAIDLTGRSGTAATLELVTPALYGWGGSGDTATLKADTIVWSGLVGSGAGVPGSPFVSATPGVFVPGGAGTGSGALVFDERRIIFGYPYGARGQDQTTLHRLALGFAGVTLGASERISASTRNNLSVYASGADPSTGFDPKTYAGTGGALTLVTSLLTGEAGSAMAYRTGGALTIGAPASGATDTASVTALGADLSLFGDTIAIDTAVALPSGRLVATADRGLTVGDHATLDLAGRAVTLFDVTKYSWGGDVLLESASGAITQAAGGRIDVSAVKADAGSIKATATSSGGTVDFAGTLAGTGGADSAGGSIDLRTGSLADFAGFNGKLNTAGFSETRSFVIKTGNLTIGDEVRAHSVTVATDGGSLTVEGKVDASGKTPGSITLAARDDLTLAAGAVLDAHGTTMALDGRGAPIAADNRGHVELTAATGTLRLASGATIDLSTPEGRYGQLALNAPRVSETGGDIRIDAGGALTLKGVDSAMLNAFWTYTLPGGSTIDQTLLNGYADAATTFIDVALANGGLRTRLAGLSALGDAFHLRPGIEIASTGDLSTSGDLDLAGYRFGPKADRDPDSLTYGAGEAMSFTIRAGGTLTVNGSISDGFKGRPGVPGTPSQYAGIVDFSDSAIFDSTYFDTTYNVDIYGSSDFNSTYYLAEDWIVPNTQFYRDLGAAGYAVGDTIPAGTVFDSSNPLGNTSWDASAPLPVLATIFTPGTSGTPPESGATSRAQIQGEGTQSAQLRLVAGADVAAADARTLLAASALRAGALGDLILDATAAKDGAGFEVPSIIRTGTGSLELLSGGNFRQNSLYGIYTAGSRTAGPDAYNDSADEGFHLLDQGGDLTLTVQGDMRSYAANNRNRYGDITSSNRFDWLQRRGDPDVDQPVAWGVDFGAFSGIGTLGGGAIRVSVGGDAGSTSTWSTIAHGGKSPTSDDSFNIVVASTGYAAGGALTQYGGGTLRLRVGGRINTGLYSETDDANSPGPGTGAVANMRGDTTITAASIGQLLNSGYGVRNGGNGVVVFDPRAAEFGVPRDHGFFTPLRLVTGDGGFTLRVRGDTGIVTASDAGRIVNDTTATQVTAFSLWTDRTGYTLFSAGGDIGQLPLLDPGAGVTTVSGRIFPADPAHFNAVTPSGSISAWVSTAPSATGSIELLAGKSLFGSAQMLGNSAAGVATPFNPVTGTTYSSFDLFRSWTSDLTALHAGDRDPIRLYAASGDVMMNTGFYYNNPRDPAAYELIVAKPVVMRAARDVLTNAYMMNNDATDISVIAAGRDILNSTIDIWGPGLLDISAGRNIYMSDRGSITSNGAIVPGDTRPGASISIAAGLGAQGPDYVAFAKLYLDPANLIGTVQGQAVPLEGSGKVAHTYEKELIAWLADRYGYKAADAAAALAYFQALAPEHQAIFVRQVYFAELRAGGREYNDANGPRYGSYVRGRGAIATLFPADRTFGGDITMFATETVSGGRVTRAGGGVRTLFGGDIAMLTPGGRQVIGVEAVTPPATAGIVTQGSGDINLYSRDSILLGLSRIMTTFGGSILGWSATGNINAGCGAKTTVVYTPPKIAYDRYGDVALSPQVPSTGAGIATLAPIADVSAGDVDLIAPLGTIDAGEAGIRVSGNVNLAALQVVNAANIQVKGNSAGIPQVPVVNVGALAAASSAASAVTQEATRVAERTRPQVRTEIPVIINVRLLGFGEQP